MVENVRIEVNPGIERIEFSNFGQFKFFFKVDEGRVFFICFVESFWGEFAAVGDPGYNAFELNKAKSTNYFYFPRNPPLLISSSGLPVKIYLKLREEATWSAVTRGN